MLNFIISSNCCRFVQRSFLLLVGPHEQEPARSRLTMTLTAFGAAETAAPAKQCCLPASEIGQAEYSCRHLPTAIHPLLPPLQVKLWFSILNKTAKPACQSGSSLVSLFPLPQDSTCSPAAAQEQGTFSNSLTPAAVWETAGLWLARESGWCSPGLAKLSRLALQRALFSTSWALSPRQSCIGGICCFPEADVWWFASIQDFFFSHVI